MTEEQHQWGSAEVSSSSSSPVPGSAGRLVQEMAEAGVLDELMDRVGQDELALSGPGGFLPELLKAVLERGLAAELTGHLGYEKYDPAGRGSPNSRNGTTPKTVASEVGDVELEVPRDRAGSFEPRLVPKGLRRLGGLDEVIISLYAGGMTVRDIQHHLARTLGTELSHDTISNVTDAVWEEVKAWQTRPLEEIYPILYLDALQVKVRDGHQVRNKGRPHRRRRRPRRDQARARHLGADHRGRQVLGRGVRRASQPRRPRCAHRLLRRAVGVRRGGRGDLAAHRRADLHRAPDPRLDAVRVVCRPEEGRRRAAADLHRPQPTADAAEAAEAELAAFADCPLGRKYPATVRTWQAAWERFIPFLAFPPEVRRIIYTTNAIESLNYQLRKIIKNRGHFPADEAVIKLLWLAIRDIEDKRARQRAKEKRTPRNHRKAPGRLVEGAVVQGWKQALGALAVAYPDRLAPYLN